jgi:hypothetical protein
MSVISVDGLRVSKSVFAETQGTPPMAGIDFEPNQADESISNVEISECMFADNAGFGVAVAHHALTAASPKTQIVVLGCMFIGNVKGAVLIAIPQPSPGVVAFEGYSMAQTPTWPIVIAENPMNGTAVTFGAGDIGVDTSGPSPHEWGAIKVLARGNNVKFDGIVVENPYPNALGFIHVAGSGAGRGLSGSFTVAQPGPAPACNYTAPVGVSFKVKCTIQQ